MSGGAGGPPADVSSPGALDVGPREACLFGGRARRGPRGEILLEDALRRVPTDLRDESLADGELVVVHATPGQGELLGCALRERAPGHAGVDVRRFAEGGVGAQLWKRHAALRAIRSYFDAQGFCEVQTPSILPCPGLDTHLDAFEVPTGAGPSAYLSTSPEYQMKRLLVGGMPRIYQICAAFRRDERGRHHDREFTMLEWYRAFAAVERVMADTEEVVCAVFEAVESSAFQLQRPFPRLTVAQAFADHAGVDEAAMLAWASHDQERFFRILVEQVEPALAASPRPVMLHRYPLPMASLARACPDDQRYAERFELYLGGVELCNGFGELCDAAEQRARFAADQQERRQLGKPVPPLDETFLGALASGMPRASGNALGVDRLLMLATGARDLGEVVAFPSDML